MRALTVRQPYAWAIIHGGKDVENRSRNIAGSYRGPVAIHAGLTDAVRDHDIDESAVSVLRAWRAWWLNEREHGHNPGGQRGHIIGVVDLVDVLPPSYYDRAEADDAWCSPWALPDHHHLVLANPRPLAVPIPIRGRLGLWTLPDDVAEQVGGAL